ncbi:drug/metabolite transporter (DMT)-like permease [Novosphingobium chloroacetimidivorans]|uniref:Drug/metabolite transporter (DMT)-like permease n=1 Tax=Novosphingobium chloroacetimidivorans TaxID=1428314 RepID=A0A7W7KC38_9SPHN|nr:DMT family transporter [Novosphingobium chloroacetimidivorans]MBB4859539.1 drug/metabolite transporter (DMT)-like permease [Novosphingobium chloroacetimidivorans]
MKAVSAQPKPRSWSPAHLAALIAANVALALGPWFVRLADTGPVAAGFWRLTLAVPVIFALSLREPAERRRVAGGTLVLVAGAGAFFALDLASWHVGIATTKLANASLFGNSGSLILMAWGLVAARRAPRGLEVAAILSALAGAALLMGSSLEVSHASFVGDLFCLLAGFFYAFYILMLAPARARLGQFSVLFWSTLTGAPILLGVAALMGEAIVPHDWTPLLVLAMSSQVIGQGLLIYSLKNFTPLVIGLALLTQPAVSALAGWLAFGEVLSLGDVAGMVLLAGALAMAKAGDKPS